MGGLGDLLHLACDLIRLLRQGGIRGVRAHTVLGLVFLAHFAADLVRRLRQMGCGRIGGHPSLGLVSVRDRGLEAIKVLLDRRNSIGCLSGFGNITECDVIP